jgi:hypothetical protein
MSDYTPIYLPGNAITGTASATITGRQTLVVSGSGTVAPSSGSSAKVVGLAAADAATNAYVTYYARGTVHESTASGAITAGDQLVSAAAGAVSSLAAASGNTAGDINSGRSVLGIALTTAIDTALVQWMEV